ncbi:MAG: T9SS type A sorting domain-containing protein [Bacteroidales bacterium]|nr:T9SS type A sorting domain-containing protein [Bacteroidales bacterium]
MKRKITLAVLLCLFSGIAFSQNTHMEYYSNDFDFLSSTFLVNSNSYVNYMVGTNNEKQLFVTELNFSPYLEPVSSNSVSFQMPDTVFIKGGFFDLDDNIVVYGYINPNKNGIIVKINMDNGSAVSIKYITSFNANTEVIDGCWSERHAGGQIFKTYDFVYANSTFMRISNELDLSYYPAFRRFPTGNIRSVSWDNINKKHVVSGNVSGSTPDKIRIGYFDKSTGLMPLKFYELSIPTGYTFSIGSQRHVLSDQDSIVFLCQDFYFLQPYDYAGLLVSKVNYISGQVYYSIAYRFGVAKTWVLDATKTCDNLFVLGHHNGLDTIGASTQPFERRFVAQFNMYDTSDYIVKFMSDYNLINMQTPCPYYVAYDMRNTLYLNNITYNPNFESVCASGAVNNKSYIIETYDLNYDTDCDSIKNIFEQSIQLAQQSYNQQLVPQNTWGNTNPNIISNYSTISFSRDIICPTSKAMLYFQERRISELQRRNAEKTFQNRNVLNTNTDILMPSAQIEIVNNDYFICKNFTSNCYFKIYDLTGRVLNEGITQNEQLNNISINKSGIYIISVRDAQNQLVQEKIMILK